MTVRKILESTDEYPEFEVEILDQNEESFGMLSPYDHLTKLGHLLDKPCVIVDVQDGLLILGLVDK